MMFKSFFPYLLALLAVTSTISAQETALAEKDVKNLAKLLSAWRGFDEFPKTTKEEKKKDEARAAFFEAVTKAGESHAGDILRFTDSWRSILREVRVGTIEKTPSGRGFLKEYTVSRSIRGRASTFDYALSVPSGYTSADRWPLILALHDEGSDGKKYLNEVWLNREVPKEIQQTYIILAPTIGEKSGGKPSEQQRITWFDALHRRGLAMCLVEVLSKYNVDMDRIYVDGTGVGGATAVELKKMWPSWFAAAASRNGLPRHDATVQRDPALVNLHGQGAIMFVSRGGELFSSEQGKARLAALDQYRESEKIDIRIKEDYPALITSQIRRALGSQKVDPVHDATADVAAFFKEMKRERSPKEINYVTYDNRSFSEVAWLRMEVATANPADKTFAEIRAKVLPESNTIEVKSNNVESFRIMLNDDILDLSKPVVITVNGKEVLKQDVTRSLEYLLGINEGNSHDPDKVAVAQVSVTVPASEEGK
jgi:poly(3-hydroxybutyrate) depolymerase